MDSAGFGLSAWGFGIWDLGFVVYVAGVVLGLLVIDAPSLERVMLAVLWPLGPIAFVVTVAILLVAAAIAYPLIGLPVLIGCAVVLWALLF